MLEFIVALTICALYGALVGLATWWVTLKLFPNLFAV